MHSWRSALNFAGFYFDAKGFVVAFKNVGYSGFWLVRGEPALFLDLFDSLSCELCVIGMLPPLLYATTQIWFCTGRVIATTKLKLESGRSAQDWWSHLNSLIIEINLKVANSSFLVPAHTLMTKIIWWRSCAVSLSMHTLTSHNVPHYENVPYVIYNDLAQTLYILDFFLQISIGLYFRYNL